MPIRMNRVPAWGRTIMNVSSTACDALFPRLLPVGSCRMIQRPYLMVLVNTSGLLKQCDMYEHVSQSVYWHLDEVEYIYCDCHKHTVQTGFLP